MIGVHGDDSVGWTRRRPGMDLTTRRARTDGGGIAVEKAAAQRINVDYSPLL
jgi:hypothetical protein